MGMKSGTERMLVAMRISVTGATALLGSNIVNAFLAAGHTLEETLRDEIAWFRQRQVN